MFILGEMFSDADQLLRGADGITAHAEYRICITIAHDSQWRRVGIAGEVTGGHLQIVLPIVEQNFDERQLHERKSDRALFCAFAAA